MACTSHPKGAIIEKEMPTISGVCSARNVRRAAYQSEFRIRLLESKGAPVWPRRAVYQKHRAHGGWPKRQTTKRPNPTTNKPQNAKPTNQATAPTHSSSREGGEEPPGPQTQVPKGAQKRKRIRAGHKGEGRRGHPNTTQNTTNKPQPRGEKWPA